MATFRARRSITHGMVPTLVLAALLVVFWLGTYIDNRFHPAPVSGFIPPSTEQIRSKTERDARYLRLHNEKTRLEARIHITRPRLEARTNALQTEEASLLDTQAHLAEVRRDIALAAPPAQASFNNEVRDFNRRRAALMANDAALARAVDDLNDDIRRRNRLAQALDAMARDRQPQP